MHGAQWRAMRVMKRDGVKRERGVGRPMRPGREMTAYLPPLTSMVAWIPKKKKVGWIPKKKKVAWIPEKKKVAWIPEKKKDALTL